jgi:hypothetical protein
MEGRGHEARSEVRGQIAEVKTRAEVRGQIAEVRTFRLGDLN